MSSYSKRSFGNNRGGGYGGYRPNNGNSGAQPRFNNGRRPNNQTVGNKFKPYNTQKVDKESRFASQIWMGDLEPNWTEEDIIKIWNGLGEAPLSVKLIKDKNDTSANPRVLYCFVNFASDTAMSSALQKDGMLIPGTSKRMKLNQATGGSSSATSDKPGRKPQDDFSLMISDIEPNVKENQIFEAFNARFPNSVRQVKIVSDPTTGLSKGFGFVKFNSSQTQQIALREMHSLTLNGKPVKLGTSVSSTSNLELSAVSIDMSTIELPQEQPQLTKYSDPFNTTVQIKGLSGRFTEQELEAYLLSHGDIIELNLHRNLNECKVTYILRESAEDAILSMNHLTIYDTELVVTWGEPISMTEDDTTKIRKHPKIYGQSDKKIRLDKLTPKQVQEWTNSIYEASEPQKSEHINQYIGSSVLNLL